MHTNVRVVSLFVVPCCRPIVVIVKKKAVSPVAVAVAYNDDSHEHEC